MAMEAERAASVMVRVVVARGAVEAAREQDTAADVATAAGAKEGELWGVG